jgi:chemotaxis protein MotB
MTFALAVVASYACAEGPGQRPAEPVDTAELARPGLQQIHSPHLSNAIVPTTPQTASPVDSVTVKEAPAPTPLPPQRLTAGGEVRRDEHREDARRDREHELEAQAKKIQEELEKLRHAYDEVRHDRDVIRAKAEDLQRRLETAEEELTSGKKALADVQNRIAALEREKEQLTVALGEARDQARDLGTKLAAEQVKSAALREDKQKLMAGTTTAKEEIARLQKRASELETEAARASDMAKRLSERDQEIAKLRKAATEREALAGRMAALTDKLERTKQRVGTLTGELALLSEEALRTRQERDRLSHEIQKQQETLKFGEALSSPTTPEMEGGPRSRTEAEIPAGRLLGEDRPRVEPSADQSGHAGNEAEGGDPRLDSAISELSRSFEADIARGDITIQKSRDRLTITMGERVLFDSGQAQLKAGGFGALKHVSEILRSYSDKQIRVEGHTDNVPIGAKLKERFPTNWELSTARATSVVRFLVEETGLDSTNLSAVGYADTRPITGNDTEEGRMANRRIEIVLYPKEIAGLSR